MRTWVRPRLVLSLFAAGIVVPGCESWWRAPEPTTRPAGTVKDPSAQTSFAATPANEGTIGAMMYVDGARRLRVRGYGLVTGLEGRGSRNCPPSVRDYLVKELRRQRAANPAAYEHLPAPDKIIDSLDTAVVVVEGEIPAAAAKRRTFDVTLQAIDPDAQSIAGGYLQPCELMIYREVGPAEIIEGKVHARARGPVFVNPFVGVAGGGTTVHPREGVVIGGGTNLLERKLSLVSAIESYSTVRQIRDAINRRFPHDPPLADAVSPTNVDLLVPEDYRGREGRFLERVLHLPIAGATVYLEGRARTLVGELTRPEAPLHELGLSLEGIGSSVVPMLQPLYTHARRPVNFYAARTGLRLGDALAIEVVIRHANDPRSPFRREAVRELGTCGLTRRAAVALRELLADPDPTIRILAYESLRRAEPSAIMQTAVGRDPENFLLEIVPSAGPAMIYARRTQIRRIALIGGDRLVCRPPLLYAPADKPVTISANDGDAVVTLLRKDAKGQVILGPLKAPLAVPPLIQFLGRDAQRDFDGKIEGLGLDYAVVLDALYRLCEQGAIQADLRWEETSVEDLLGPSEPVGRPESEL